MNHNKSYRKLGRRADHRKAMLKNMTISLIKAERIESAEIGRASCRERV